MSEKKIVKFGIVGLGRGLTVMKCIAADDNVEIRAICDIKHEMVEKAKKELVEVRGVPEDQLLCFDNYDEMLEKADIDAVFIATDAVYHVPFVIKAMEHGLHVCSEIPAVNSLEEAKLLRKTVKAHPELKYMAAECCCWWGFIDLYKKMYDKGEFGDIVYAESCYLHSEDYKNFRPEDFPKEHWRQYNPAIKYLTHNLGPLLYIMDDYCVSVTCMEPDVVYNPYRVRPQNGVALFKTAKGAVIRILIIFDAFVENDYNFTLIGTRGTIETDNIKHYDDAYSYARLDSFPGSLNKKLESPVNVKYRDEKVVEGGHGGSDTKMMRAFVKSIVDDTPVPIDVDLSIRMALPGIIAVESAEKGGEPVMIPDPKDFE